MEQKTTVNKGQYPRVCKNPKCMKPLPENYKEAYCEACLNKQAKGIKVAGGVAAGVLGTIVSVGIALLKNGKKS